MSLQVEPEQWPDLVEKLLDKLGAPKKNADGKKMSLYGRYVNAMQEETVLHKRYKLALKYLTSWVDTGSYRAQKVSLQIMRTRSR